MRFIPIPWPKLGLQVRLLTVIALVLLGIGITQPLLQTHQLTRQYRQDMAQQLATSLDGLQLAMQDQVIIGDYTAIDQILRVWAKQSDIEYAEWRGSEARPLRATNPVKSTAPVWFDTYAGLPSDQQVRTFSFGARTYGELKLGISGARWTDRLWNRFTQRLRDSAIEFALIFAAITIVFRTGLGSLSSLVHAARRFRAGHYGERGQLTPGMAPEMREIVQAVNYAAEYLAQIMHGMQGASDAICICNLEEQALFVNRAFSGLFGYSLEQINAAGGVARAIGHPMLLETMLPLVKQGKYWSGQVEVETRDHGARTLLIRASSVFNEVQMVIGFMTSISDITEQQRVMRLNERLGRLLDNAQNEIYVFDAETQRFIQVNRGACTNLGYTLDELRALTAVDIQSHFSLEAFETLIAPLRKHRVDHLKFVTTHQRKNGSKYPVNVQLQYSDAESPAVFYAIIEDITERQNVERWLRESEEKFRALVESSSDWVWAIDAEYRYTYSSPTVREILGFEPGEIMGRHASELMPGGGWGRFATLFAQNAQIRSPSNLIENVKQHKHGRRVILETSAVPIFDEQGYLRGYRGIDRDITARKQVEEALQESMARYRSIVSHIPGMVFQLVLGPGGKLSFPFVSEGAKSVCDLDAHTLHTDIQHFLDRLDRHDQDAFFAGLGESAGQLADWQWEGRIVTSEGPRWINLYGSPYQRSDGSIIWDGVMLDITASKQVQIDITQSRDQLRELSTFLQAAREDEKAAIARDIHDELGGTLTALKMDAYWLEQKLATIDPALRAKAADMTVLLDSTVRTVRRISSELRPTVLDDLGFPAALEWLARELQKRIGAPCRVNMPSIEPEINQNQALALFRIAQESFTNIARHAHASEVNISFGVQGDALQLDIRDNGVGIAADRIVEPTSRGIRGMYERARLLGGDIFIEGHPGQGSVVRAMLPLIPYTGHTDQ